MLSFVYTAVVRPLLLFLRVFVLAPLKTIGYYIFFPPTYVLGAFLNIVNLAIGLVASFETVLIFMASAMLIGIISGSTVFATSKLTFAILGLQVADPEQPRPSGPMSLNIRPLASKSSERTNAHQQLEYRNLMSQTITEEDDSDS